MKKMKILKINFVLKFDTLYVFYLKRNCSYQVVTKNDSFTIRTDRFGFAMFCFDVNKIRKTDENNLLRFRVITDDCKSVSIHVFDNLMQKRILSFLLLKIKEANANRTSAIVSTNNSKSPVNTLAKVNSKKKASKMSFRSFVSKIAQLLDKTKSRFNDLLNIENFSYKEFSFKESLKIYSKKFNAIYSDLTENMHVVNVKMRNSIFTLLN